MYERAMFVARTFKVKTGRDRAFLATEKYMSEKRSDWAAFQSANRAKVRFEETPCAKELKSLELDKSKELTPEQTKDRLVALGLVFAVVIFFWMSFHQNGKTAFFAGGYRKSGCFGGRR